jgi:hypothetical protein
MVFCEYFQINPIPTTVQVLCFYAQFLSRSFKSVNSIKNYLSGVKLLHLYLDDDYPKFDEFVVLWVKPASDNVDSF